MQEIPRQEQEKDLAVEIRRILEGTVDQYTLTPQEIMQAGKDMGRIRAALDMINQVKNATAKDPGSRPAWLTDVIAALEGFDLSSLTIVGKVANYEQAVKQIKTLVAK